MHANSESRITPSRLRRHIRRRRAGPFRAHASQRPPQGCLPQLLKDGAPWIGRRLPPMPEPVQARAAP
eukprot:5512192-Pyramimonas_sp.AAC.1